MVAALIIFVVAGFFWAHVLFSFIKRKPAPKKSVIIHNILIASGLTIVFYETSGIKDVFLDVIFYILLVAAILGIYIALKYFSKKKRIKKTVLYIHPVLAAVGIILLTIYTFTTF